MSAFVLWFPGASWYDGYIFVSKVLWNSVSCHHDVSVGEFVCCTALLSKRSPIMAKV